LHGKTLILTGSAGISAATARLAQEAGARVVSLRPMGFATRARPR
jgi:hypothetical protein